MVNIRIYVHVKQIYIYIYIIFHMFSTCIYGYIVVVKIANDICYKYFVSLNGSP